MATPTLVQYVHTNETNFSDTGTFRDYSSTGIEMYLPNNTLSGNFLFLSVCAGSGVTSFTISDNIGGSWTTGKQKIDTTNTQAITCYYKANATAGVNHITIANSSGLDTAYQLTFSEWYNIATSSPADTTGAGASGSSTSPASGSFTTTSSGDLILNVMACDNTVPANTTITPGSGFTFLGADRVFGTACQYKIQSSAGAINPGMTLGTTNGWVTVAMAFKAASAGTAPGTGYRVIRKLSSWIDNASSFTLQLPCSGNLLVGIWDGYGNSTTANTLTSITDSNSNAWTSRGSVNHGAPNPATAQFLDTDAATTTTSAGMTLTLNLIETAYECTFTLLDIAGAPLTSGNFDTTAGFQYTSGNQAAAGVLTTVSITPSTANGLVCTETVIDIGTLQTLSSPPSNTFSCITIIDGCNGNGTGGSGQYYPSGSLDEDNGRALTYNAGTSALQYKWAAAVNNQNGQATVAVSYWASCAVAYKGAASGGSSYWPGRSAFNPVWKPLYAGEAARRYG